MTAVNLRFILITPVTGLYRIVLLQYKIKVLSTVIRKCYTGKEKLDTLFLGGGKIQVHRVEYKKGRHVSDPYSSTTLESLCTTFIHAFSSPASGTMCSILLRKMS